MYGTNMGMRKRLTWVLIIASGFFVVLMSRLAWVQFVHGGELQKKALEVRMRDIPVEAKRGAILDCNGNELVTSISVDSIYATPGHVKDPQEAAEKIAPILGMDVDKVYAKLTKKSSFEWIKRKVDNKASQQIRDLNLAGIGFVEESKRYYLHPTLAPHVLGFAGTDNQGLIGIEKSYDAELRGQAGRIVIEYDAAGRQVPEAIHQYIPPKPGYDLVLTIDETIQYFVERELDKVVAQYNPKFALAIVMDPETGGILAMGNRPTFDPNRWMEAPREVWDKNPAIWYNYEPGSTFKIVTAASALEQGTVHPGDSFYDPGFIKVADHNLRCWKAGGHGSQTFAEVVQNSCNPGFAEVGMELGKDNFYKYIKAFGFGSPMGINLPGESGGIIIPQKQATNLNLAIMSIGQSIAVTPIQLVSAAAAVANDGVLMRPQLVKELQYNGKTIEKIKPEKVREVVSVETSRQLRSLLESVVAEGTGSNAFVEGYRVGGKTGTAQVVGEKGGYVSGKYVASFAGMAPVDDPKMVALVVIAEPQGGSYYGGVVAAPVFQGIARDTLRYLGLPEIPSQKKPKKPWEVETPVADVTVPNVVSYTLDEAVKVLKAAGLQYQTSGEGNIVNKQMPGAGGRVKYGTSVILTLQPIKQRGKEGELITVPMLKGLTIKEAGNLLEEIGLRLVPEGSGLAVTQSINPGTKVTSGTSVKVKFAPPSDNEVVQPPSGGSETAQIQSNLLNPYE
ncbi:Stage V sporulation protein D [Sporotomaculum syntrophicum]|uniref:Stage V sporulation protein D n=1 Tax=Sporotomaculum syntrophicum TaxID=182264 RepID=A0A9D3AXB7_9FIRM|nr:stage V sporulation protein D [Sporotomaculum syntrophicum]KAF1084867.1 Stage V sporulation protein D [Sporotomaculum syntrophicum]